MREIKDVNDMKYIKILGLLFISLLSHAQNRLVNIDVGDEIPHIILNNVYDSKEHTVNLRNLSNNRLVIIDFWATWCGACLKAMPMMDSLAMQYIDKLKVITVTKEAKSPVLEFFKKRRQVGLYVHQTAKLYADTLLYKLFPHYLIPHYVWIKNGKVIAITEKVTREAVESAVNQGTINLRKKADKTVMQLDRYKKSLLQFLHNDEQLDFKNVNSYSFVMGYVDALGPSGGYSNVTLDSSLHKKRFTGVNMSLERFYRVAYGNSRTFINEAAVDITSDDAYFKGSNLVGMEYEDWLEKYAVSYEVVVGAGHDLFKKMALDLQDAFPQFEASLVRTRDTCLVLEFIDENPETQGKVNQEIDQSAVDNDCKVFVDRDVVSLMIFFESSVFRNSKIPVIDGTNYSDKINLKLCGRLGSLEQVNTALFPYGLQVNKKVAWYDKLVVADRK